MDGVVTRLRGKDIQSRSRYAAIRCRNCHEEVCGASDTIFGKGWVHKRTNRERCSGDHASVAEPHSIDPFVPYR